MAQMKKIRLGRKELYTLVDDSDYEILSQYKWFRLGSYVARMEAGKWILMHRQIMQAPADKHIDHRNGDPLDNRRFNLRICTLAENLRNRTKMVGASSIYKGVSWFKPSKSWRARISVDDSTKIIGYFKNERHAALAYDIAAKDLHGEFASLNFQSLTQ